MITHKQLEQYLLSLPSTWLDYPFGPEVAVYKVGNRRLKTANREGSKMFALIAEKSAPVRLSLKCDPKLAEVLRQKYESVQPGYHLNKKHWNTIVCSGQLGDAQLRDLIRLSYNLVAQSVKK